MSDQHDVIEPEIVTPGARTQALAATTMHPLVQMAMNQGHLDPAALEKLLDLQERFEASEGARAFQAAMVEMKKTLPVVIGHDQTVKNRDGSKRYGYTSHAAMVAAIEEHLLAHGFSIGYESDVRDGKVRVTARLTHVQKHSITSTSEAAPDNSQQRTPAQAVESTKTGLKRSTLMDLLGRATGEVEDDARYAERSEESAAAVDESRTVKALAAVQRAGRTKAEAEVFAGRPAKEWTNNDIDKIKAWLATNKTPPPAEPAHDPQTGEVPAVEVGLSIVAECKSAEDIETAVPRLEALGLKGEQRGRVAAAMASRRKTIASAPVSE